MQLLQVARDMRDIGRHADAERVMEEVQPDCVYVRRSSQVVFRWLYQDTAAMLKWRDPPISLMQYMWRQWLVEVQLESVGVVAMSTAVRAFKEP